MNNLSELTEIQREIYEQLAAGKTPEQIAKRIGSTEALVKANMTRITNKGVKLPESGSQVPQPPPTYVPIGEVLASPSGKPPNSYGSENDRIAAMVSEAGPAISAEELRALADKVAGKAAREVHPMILMGVTIQYVKMCGGRMTAHQVIEDVYAALKSFVGTVIPDDGGETVKLPKTDAERLVFLEESNKSLQEQIQALEAKLRERNSLSYR